MNARHFLGMLSVLLGGALAFSFASAANAGGCEWGGCEQATSAPVVHRTFKKRIQVEQGVYEIARRPSLYGWTVPVAADAKGASWADDEGGSRRVLLKPYRNYAIYHRAKHINATERVAIQPEEPTGEWSWWDRLWDR
jgi:hypothetical protein